MKNCPCCKDTLLRYICRSEIIWICPTCRQQMPNPEALIGINQVEATAKKEHNNNQSLPPFSNPQNNYNLEESYLKPEVYSLKSFVAKNKFRLEIVNFILSYQNLLIAATLVNQVSQPQNLIYSEQEIDLYQQKAACLYSTQLVLNCIAYAFLIGDISVLNHSSLNSLKQTYINIGIPFTNLCCEIQSLKLKIISSIEQAGSNHLKYITKYYCACLVSELEAYFDAAVTVINV